MAEEDRAIIEAFLTLANSNERAREFLLYKLFNHVPVDQLRQAMDAWLEHVERMERIKASDSYRRRVAPEAP